MRTSGRCPVACAAAGAAVPGPGGPGSGTCRSRDRARSARAAGFHRTGVRRPALCAASCQVWPCTSRTGRRRSAGMTAIPAPGQCSRSWLPGAPGASAGARIPWGCLSIAKCPRRELLVLAGLMSGCFHPREQREGSPHTAAHTTAHISASRRARVACATVRADSWGVRLGRLTWARR